MFNAIAAGVLIFTLSAAGLSMASNLVSGIFSTKDKIDTAKEIFDTSHNVQNANSNTANRKVSIIDTDGILDSIDLDPDNIAEILDKIVVNTSDNKLNKLIILDYSESDTDSKYIDNVISKLKSYSGAVSVALVNSNILTSEEMQTEIDKIQKIVSDNIDYLKDTNFRRTATGGTTNSPNAGNFTFIITYTEN